MNKLSEDLKERIDNASHIVIIQADNPDADSLGSALGIEEILAAMGKETTLYCGIDIPTYLHYLAGWSRVNKTLPQNFDTALIVDASTTSLLEKITHDSNYNQYIKATKLVLDHHETVENPIDAQLTINNIDVSSASELIYSLANELNWPLNPASGEALLAGILGDTQGLSNNLAKPSTFRAVASILELGVSREDFEEKRREYNKFHKDIYAYKAQLIQRTEFHNNSSIACVVVDQQEINTYSPLYNPAALIQPDMLQIENVKVTIVFKCYADGKVTAAIRCGAGAPIAGLLAKEFDGGGHNFASGFKRLKVADFQALKSEVIAEAINQMHSSEV